MKKLDWVFGNIPLHTTWPAARAVFLPRQNSDHSAMILRLEAAPPRDKCSFKFINLWAQHGDFMEIVQGVWNQHIVGNPMFQLTAKLGILKQHLRGKHRNSTSHISHRVFTARKAWNAAQESLDSDPQNVTIGDTERHLAKTYMNLCKEEEAFYKQRSRVQWLTLGDHNTKFFHRSLLHRNARNTISSLQDDVGRIHTGQQVIGEMAVGYFKNILHAPINAAERDNASERDSQSFYPRAISEEARAVMSMPIMDKEIKDALFSIPDDKAPGPDGYTSLFFKSAWSIVGKDFTAAVHHFFLRKHLPRCVNATRIALVPKKENPNHLDDFRPISCCNVIYKCISKILVSRLQVGLLQIISPEQTAFIAGRSISDAIHLTQDLMHNYHLDGGPARCAIKVDLRKAFDTLNWDFILAAMRAIKLPANMVEWIAECITSPHFSLSINGNLQGFFPASRGLRQGDPLSPYLFILAMEGLTSVLRQASHSSRFKHHWRCEKTAITHLCFADDLMIFSHGDVTSVGIIKDALDTFMQASGLSINFGKSSLFMAGIREDKKEGIISRLGIQLKTLPVSYLGVPLITSRLTKVNCIPLIDRITARIRLWTSASLSYAGRLQLIKAVLFSIQVYWASHFILPTMVVKQIEQIMRNFLWRGPSLSRGDAKVAWRDVCCPVTEGGLGIKGLSDWNVAATIKTIWNILSNHDSIWVTWVHAHLLKGKPFWEVSIPNNPSWIWRKMLQAREVVRGSFSVTIGNGRNTFLWYDYWLPGGKCFCDLFPIRMLTTTGLAWNSRVAKIIEEDRWVFPSGLPQLQQVWGSINFLPNTSREDCHVWKHSATGQCTIKTAWNLIRIDRPILSGGFMWHSWHIPRHSFILWLASKGRLRTMDRLHNPAQPSTNCCVLCSGHEEDHNHLFFDCVYSAEVWQAISQRAQIRWPNLQWSQAWDWVSAEFNSKKNPRHNMGMLVLAATVYHLWCERNRRLFKQVFCSSQRTTNDVIQAIRIRLANTGGRESFPVSILRQWSVH